MANLVISYAAGTTFATDNSGAGGVCVIPLPTYITGDVLFLMVNANQSRNIALPSGWSDLPGTAGGFKNNSSLITARLMYRVADGSEGSTVTVTTGTFGRVTGHVIRARNVLVPTIFDTLPQYLAGTATTPNLPASLAATQDDVSILRFANWSTPPTSLPTPAGHSVLAWAQGSTKGAGWNEGASASLVALLATGQTAAAVGWTTAGFSANHTYTLALKPAPEPVPEAPGTTILSSLSVADRYLSGVVSTDRYSSLISSASRYVSTLETI